MSKPGARSAWERPGFRHYEQKHVSSSDATAVRGQQKEAEESVRKFKIVYTPVQYQKIKGFKSEFDTESFIKEKLKPFTKNDLKNGYLAAGPVITDSKNLPTESRCSHIRRDEACYEGTCYVERGDPSKWTTGSDAHNSILNKLRRHERMHNTVPRGWLGHTKGKDFWATNGQERLNLFCVEEEKKK
jgi:hypothetical protein